MAGRTTETAVTFQHPFKLGAFGREQPAGTYRLVIDEEEIRGLTFLAYQRSATMLHTPAISASSGVGQVFTISAEELANALEADSRW